MPVLTGILKRNNGVFPAERVYAIIEGRQDIKEHGGRDMPARGDRYMQASGGARAAEYYIDVPYDMDAYARAHHVTGRLPAWHPSDQANPRKHADRSSH